MANELKQAFIDQIKGKGFPVITIFDFMDSNIIIWVKSESDIFVGGCYGEEIIEGDGSNKTLEGIKEEGLFHLYHDGVRPGEKYWDSSLQGAEEDEQYLNEE